MFVSFQLILGDLNMETSSPELKKFIEQYGLYSLIKTPTCYKSPEGRCIDLMLTNNHRCFFGSQSFETGFSDFHHMVYSILKTTFVRCLSTFEPEPQEPHVTAAVRNFHSPQKAGSSTKLNQRRNCNSYSRVIVQTSPKVSLLLKMQ